MRHMRQQTSMRLSAETLALRKALSEKLGVSPSGIVELAVRKLAEAEHVTLAPPKTKTKPPRK